MSKNNKKQKCKPSLEEVLTYINSLITVDRGKIQSGNPILREIINKILEGMKVVSPLFKVLFQSHQYAASSYDGLKIGKENKFDIDLKLRLPKILDIEVLTSDRTGFVRLYIKNWDTVQKDKHLYSIYKEVQEFKDEHDHISHLKIRKWLRRIITQAISRIGQYTKFGDLEISNNISGPALTLTVGDKMTVDLVAVFCLPGEKWPAPPFRQNIHEKQQPDFIAVPKGPKYKPKMVAKYSYGKYWRLSFPEQERQYMFGKSFCKPAIRYLKKLSDTKGHKIPSYFIKTIFLWELQKGNHDFWRSNNSLVFIEMLKTYKTYLENRRIPYFWDASYNLLQPSSRINILDITKYLEGMIKDIEKIKFTKPIALAKHILSAAEYEKTCKHFGVSKI